MGYSKIKGSALIMVLLFSSLLTAVVLFIWESALLQSKMANNHQVEVINRIQSETSK